MVRIICLCLIFSVGSILVSFGQFDSNADFPEIGKPMPDFTIRNLEDYPKSSVSLSDLKGKWLILDFWSKYCSGCIKSFPKMNALYQKYKEKLELVEVCYVWHEGGEEAMYAKFKKNEHLNFPVAFDSLLCQRFNISGVPHFIVLDPNGIVKAITNQLDENDVRDFLKGDTPISPESYTGAHVLEKAKLFNRKIPLLVQDNGGTDTSFIFRFVLTRWNKEAGYITSSMEEELEHIPSRIDLTNITLRNLYFYAFTGHYYDIPFKDSDYRVFYPIPLIETKDSLLFKNRQTMDNTFCFSLTMPPKIALSENIDQFENALQKELNIYFGYDARLEIRMMPYYKLVVNSVNLVKKIKTKGHKPSGIGDWAGVAYINQPISLVLDRLSYGHTGGPIIIDETGITSNVDMKLDVPFNASWDTIRAEFLKSGLDIVEGKKPMKVLIIRDNFDAN